MLSLALTVLFVVVPAGVYAWGRTSSTFDVRHVQVVGSQRVSQRAALRLLQERFVGRNLFSVSDADVANALQPLVYLASAKVDRHFPSTLIVRVREFRPGAYVLSDGRWYLVSDDGHVLADVGGEKRKPAAALAAVPKRLRPRLPAILGTAPLKLRAATTQAQILDALTVARAMPAAVRAQTERFFGKADGLHVALRSGLEIVFGSADGLRDKVLSLQAVTGYYRAKHVKPTYVDVSLPDRPLAKPKLAPQA